MKVRFCLLLLSLCLTFFLRAQTLVIDDYNRSSSLFQLYPYMKLVDAELRQYNVQEYIADYPKLNAQPIVHQSANTGFTDHYYWLNFSITNTTNTNLVYYLEAARPITDYVYLYTQTADGNIKKQQSGDAIPFKERDFNHRKSVFKVELAPNQTTNFYLNLKSDGEVLNLGLKLHTADDFIISTYNEQLVYGIFYGIIFLASITYVFFYFALHDKTFLYYSLYVITIGLMQFSLDGMWFQYFGPSAGMLSLKGVILFASLATLFFGMYGKSFLRINDSLPQLNKLYVGHAYATGLLLVLIVLPIQIPTFSYLYINALALFILFTLMGTIVIMYVKRIPVDPFFTVGIGSLALGMTFFILNNFGVIPNSFLTENSSKLGTGAEVIFLSLSMSNLIRKLKSEKEKAQTIALKKSEDMNELKSYFMSNMSHELRTPLNAIMGIADVMLKEQLEDKVRSNFEVIKYSSLSLLSSVNDVLDFSQIERGELKLNSHDFEPHLLFNQIKLNSQKQAADKELLFTFEVDERLPKTLHGDSVRFAQIINNVLNNAIKFTNVGYIHVKINVLNKHDDKADLQIIISDSGVGIPKDKMDTIYESFMQESISNTRKFGGLGLGLSIVKKLVELYHGDIQMESKIGRGTKCTLQLPFTIAADKPKVKEVPPTQSNQTIQQGLNVLVVEDNSMNQLLMKMILKQWKDTQFAMANHGGECLNMLQQDRYDVILMDLQMPVMDGYEAATAIRAGEAGVDNLNIPIIAITADVTEGTEQRVKQIGMDAYLTKPVNQERLYKIVMQLTKGVQVG